MNFSEAWKATLVGSWLAFPEKKSFLLLSAQSFNWSIAAALKVSHAENKTLSLLSLNILPILPIVVV